jgi:hypothetical protein
MGHREASERGEISSDWRDWDAGRLLRGRIYPVGGGIGALEASERGEISSDWRKWAAGKTPRG